MSSVCIAESLVSNFLKTRCSGSKPSCDKCSARHLECQYNPSTTTTNRKKPQAKIQKEILDPRLQRERSASILDAHIFDESSSEVVSTLCPPSLYTASQTHQPTPEPDAIMSMYGLPSVHGAQSEVHDLSDLFGAFDDAAPTCLLLVQSMRALGLVPPLQTISRCPIYLRYQPRDQCPL